MDQQLIEFIRSKISVNEEELRRILLHFRVIKAKKNEILLTEGEASRHTFFVKKGCLRIFFINEDGQESTRYFAFENQFATALVSFITAAPSKEFIQAVEDAELYVISHKNFYALLDIVPQWEKFYRLYLEFAYVNNTNRLMSFLLQDALAKYKQFLAENPVIVRRLSNKMVASYLNISQETLSRLKSKL